MPIIQTVYRRFKLRSRLFTPLAHHVSLRLQSDHNVLYVYHSNPAARSFFPYGTTIQLPGVLTLLDPSLRRHHMQPHVRVYRDRN